MANPPPHFIVFVPGYMGSRLRNRRTGELVWLDIPGLLRNPFDIPGALERMFDQMRYPNDDLIPDGIVDEVLFLPPLFKQEQYGRMLDALARMGYNTSGNPVAGELAAYTFAYDWRQDNRISARQLGQFIEDLEGQHPDAKAVLIGHSNGGIVSRWYIEKEGGANHVSRLFLMGSPWDGAPKAFQVLQDGLEVFLMGIFNRYDNRLQEKIKSAVLSFPSFYQLIPSANPFLHDANGNMLDPFTDLSWLQNERQRQMLLDGRLFNQQLGTTLSVETLCFFGVKTWTTTGGLVHLNPSGRWSKFDWERTEEGDGTVPMRSAVHPQASQKLPFVASHGDIYIVPPVLEKMEFELLTKYRLGVLAEAETPNLTIHFEPDRDVYQPGEEIHLWATVAQRDSGEPISEALIDIRLELRQPLPNFPQPQSDTLPALRLHESEQESGRYEGVMQAPRSSGYYRLVAAVNAPGEAPVPLEELILVEGAPEWSSSASGSAPGAPGAPPPPSSPGSQPPPPITGGPIFRSWDEPPQPAPSDLDSDATGIAGRAIHVEITEGELNRPLPFNQEFTLAFYVDEKTSAFSVPFREDGLFSNEQSPVHLMVQVASSDFIVHTRQPQELRVPRRGRSRNKARFDLEPLHSGSGRLAALIYKDNNFVQGIDIELNVAGGETTARALAAGSAITHLEALGRPVENLGLLKPRDVLLFIKNRGDSFELTLVDQTVSEARLPVSSFQLSGIIARARQALLDVVYLAKSPTGVSVLRGRRPSADTLLAYQAEIDIPEDIAQKALQMLAEAGFLLFQDLFYGPSAGADAQAMGDRLRQLAEKSALKLQIVSQHFFLPWGLLYLGEDIGQIQPDLFLGLRHVVEHIPLQASPPVFTPDISGLPRLAVSVNVDSSIDQAMGRDFVARQLNYWKPLQQTGAADVAIRQTDQEWLEALRLPTADQIIYFYGHALTPAMDDPTGTDNASLSFADNKKVTLRDLRLNAAERRRFPGEPLVFINACESAELSPLFYSGFMPYFTAKGARGMIGTECEVPAVFAAEWALRFFDRFLYQERPIGEIFLELRREFFYQHNNILGLLYALYCDGDTRVYPALARTPP